MIRAEEHLSNTPRQVFIAQSLGYRCRQYAHLPFVAEPGSKNKLSKRKLDKYLKNRDFAELVEHGREIAEAIGHPSRPTTFNPVIVDFYQQVGYLPEAIVNYLALLGWSLDDKTEHFTREEMIEHFSLERVNKAPASFDPQKLMAFEEWHMQRCRSSRKWRWCCRSWSKAGLVTMSTPRVRRSYAELESEVRVRLRIARASDSQRCATGRRGGRRPDQGGRRHSGLRRFLPARRPVGVRREGGRKTAPQAASATELLAKFRDRLAEVEPFEPPALEASMQRVRRAEGIKIGQIIHAAPRGGHRQGGRLRPVRHPGHPRPRAMFAAD